MRISEVANLGGLTPKDVIDEIESQRDALTAKGAKLPKKLTAASAIDPSVAGQMLAQFDSRKKQAKEQQEQQKREADRAADEKRRAEEAARQQKIDEDRRKAAEEARRKADEDLAKRRAQMAALTALPVPPAAPVAPAPAPATPAPIAAAPAPVAPIAAASPAAVAPTAAAPVAPSAAPAVAPTPGSSPVVQIPGIRVIAQPPSAPAGGSGHRSPLAGPPPIPNASLPPSATRVANAGRDSQGPPQRRDGGPSGPPSARPQGPRRDQGGNDRGGPRPSGPGGPRPSGPGGARPGIVSKENLQSFITGALQPSVNEDFKRRRPDDRTGGGPPKDRKRDDDSPAARAKKRAKGAEDAANRSAFRPTQIFDGEVVTRRPGARADKGRRGKPGMSSPGGPRSAPVPAGPKAITLFGDFTVGQFAERASIDAAEVIKKLFMMGEMKTINQLLDPDLAELIAVDLGIEIIVQRESDELDVEEFVDTEVNPENMRPRAPIVTVMGHVDHGKTTLLDRIRSAKVVDSEFGGITQHIGAYHVPTAKGDIVFLDTPGHEAFTAMRARGANVTDLVILVVAANDGVKPQTIEAINHAKAAKVPIIVAINKMDAEGANPQRVRQELMRFELVSEDLGGDTLMVEVSALKGKGINELLELVALQAEVLELKADPDRPALGAIVESRVDAARGAVATVLVQQGTLRLGDIFVCGTEYGRIRAMRDDKGQPLTEAGPSRPVEILGLTGSPAAGEQFVVVEEEAQARDIAERRDDRRRLRSVRVKPHVSLDNLAEHVRESEAAKTLNLILKADVQGSLEAVSASLLKIKSDKIIISILHTGVGPVGESDVMLADASDAIILGFNVRPDPSARALAEETGVEIKLYNVIYHLLEEIEQAMVGMLDPVFEEQHMSRSVVLEIFKVSKVGNIAGVRVEEGTIGRDHKVRLVRGGSVIWTGKLASLRRVKDDVKEVSAVLECGLGLHNFNDVKEGDVIESFTMKQLAATLVNVESPAAKS